MGQSQIQDKNKLLGELNGIAAAALSDVGSEPNVEIEVDSSETIVLEPAAEEALAQLEEMPGAIEIENMVNSVVKAPKTTKQRVEELKTTLNNQRSRLSKLDSPVSGQKAYDYLLEKASAQFTEDEDGHNLLNAIYDELTLINCIRVKDQLMLELQFFNTEDKRLEVVAAIEASNEKDATMEWLRKAEKVLENLLVLKYKIKLERTISYWKNILPASVAQAPVDRIKTLLEATKPEKKVGMAWVYQVKSALRDLSQFKPVCGCGCKSELKRRNAANGQPGKGSYFASCYNSSPAGQAKKKSSDAKQETKKTSDSSNEHLLALKVRFETGVLPEEYNDPQVKNTGKRFKERKGGKKGGDRGRGSDRSQETSRRGGRYEEV